MLVSSLDQRPAQAVETRPASSDAAAALLSTLEGAPFDPARVGAAVERFPVPRSSQERFAAPGIGARDGRTFRLEVGPGVVACRSLDVVRAERTRERQVHRAMVDHDLRVQRGLEGLDEVESVAGEVTEWSAKSRSRMVRAFGSVDWSPLVDVPGAPLGMITLTYPGDWLAVAPDGATAKRHLRAFLERWRRALGSRLVGAWKLEFQRRGAPHFHILTAVPAMVKGRSFEAWLSSTWAAVVGAVGDERVRHEAAGTGVDFAAAGRMSDPKRMSVYFLKHSTKTADDKEYQHIVPEAWREPGKGPGRFWGFWGLPKATEELDLDLDDFVTVRRRLRKIHRARARRIAYNRTYSRARRLGGSPRLAAREGRRAMDRVPRARLLGVGGQLIGGWVLCNDGPQLAVDLSRAVALQREVRDDLAHGIPDYWP